MITNQDFGRSSVALVDDDKTSRIWLRRILRNIDADLVECRSSEDVLERLQERDFAAAVVDVMLPGMDGFELTQAIRGLDRNADVPVIFLTGQITDDAQLARGYDLGAVDFLEKSISDKLLETKISVFVGLDQRQRQVIARERQQQALAREQEEERERLEQMGRNAARFRMLTSEGSMTSVTGASLGSGPVKDRASKVFARMVDNYHDLLDKYLEQLVVSSPKPVKAMADLIRELGTYGGTPRDLLDIHVAALEAAVQDANPRRAEAYSIEGRLLALEMMGFMVDYYRTGISQLTKNGD